MILVRRVALLMCMPVLMQAQNVRPTAAAGIAQPVAGFGKYRDAGPLARVGVVIGRDHASEYRLDLEYAWMPGRNRLPSFDARDKDMSSVGVFITYAVGPNGTRWAPFFVIGAGLLRLTAAGVDSRYGKTGGVRTGLGLSRRFGQRRGYVELLAHLNFTDFGAGDYEMGSFFPLVAGLRF